MSRNPRPSANPTASVVILLLIVLAGFWLQRGRQPGTGTGTGPVQPHGTASVGPGGLPDSRLTPGDVLTTDAQAVCRPGYSKSVRNVPASVKQQVYSEYHIASHQPGEYEVDHLISLELGGSNSVRNLWPQSYVTKPLNAHVKDALENRLHARVCSGDLALSAAQQAIAQDWEAAYVKYVGPLPTQ